MASKVVCDRCGYEESRGAGSVLQVEVNIAMYSDDKEFINKDFCRNCIKDLKEVLEPLPLKG